MLRSRICTGFGREVVCENADALDGHVFGRLNARHNDWFPHVNPILDVCGKGDSKKGLKSLRSVANEDIDINGKYLIAFQVKQFHFLASKGGSDRLGSGTSGRDHGSICCDLSRCKRNRSIVYGVTNLPRYERESRFFFVKGIYLGGSAIGWKGVH